MMKAEDFLCQIENLHVSFYNQSNGDFLNVVRGVDFHVKIGEILGIVGESGSGKTVTSASIMQLHSLSHARVSADRLEFDGLNMMTMSEKQLEKVRGKRIAMIFQNPVEALCPHQRIQEQFIEGFKMHGMQGEVASIERVNALLKEMGIEDAPLTLRKYPHQLSGGQAQRVSIAMALSLNPDLIIADEPTSSIDASLSRLILERLKWINETFGIGIILITHDFEVAKTFCHRILVMYGGLVMEEKPSRNLVQNAGHPYTLALIKCVQSLKINERKLYTLPGGPLDPQDFSEACPFSKRCENAISLCFTQIPGMNAHGEGRIRCFNPQLGGMLSADTYTG